MDETASSGSYGATETSASESPFAIASTWQHRKGDRYAAVRSYPQGNPDTGYYWSHWWDSHEMTTLAAAKREGFKSADSDDFNILAIRGGAIVAVLWMAEVIDTDPDVLAAWEDSRP